MERAAIGEMKFYIALTPKVLIKVELHFPRWPGAGGVLPFE